MTDLRSRGLRVRRRLVARALRPVQHVVRDELAPLRERLTELDAPSPEPPPAAGLSGPDLHHALRTAEVARMPREEVRTILSAGCAGRWYFDWIAEHYTDGDVERHIGVEWYSPEPDDLPPEVTWIRNTVGEMSNVTDGEVDLVFSGQNVEHLSAQDVVAFLGEAHRVLRPGGPFRDRQPEPLGHRPLRVESP